MSKLLYLPCARSVGGKQLCEVPIKENIWAELHVLCECYVVTCVVQVVNYYHTKTYQKCPSLHGYKL